MVRAAPPGDAVARIKGVAMLNAVKALRGQKSRARDLLPSHIHWYLDERIMVSGWYPENDQLALIRALAQVLPPTGMDVYEFMGRFTAQRDLVGLYGHMLKMGDPEATLRRGPAIWKAYHDTGTLQVTFTGPGLARIQISDYGLPSTEMCRLLLGWYGELVRMTGARNVEIVEAQCRHRKDVACVWEVKWEPEEPGAGREH